MTGRPKVVLLGMMSKIPVAGVVWQTVHYLVGLERLGYDAYYVEAHARTPSMFMERETDDAAMRAAAFIAAVMERFGLPERWAFHALHGDGRLYGMGERKLARLYREATLILNLHGSTVPLPEHTESDRLVYVETDPVDIQVELHEGNEETRAYLEPHCAFFTFGENYGNADCGLPVSDVFDFRPTRQPVVLDFWRADGPPRHDALTTIASWRQPWRQVTIGGEVYHWSKDREFLTFIELPSQTPQPFELALGAYEESDRQLLLEHGWSVRDVGALSGDVDAYRRYITDSRGEFTVAKDQNIRLRTGWFSDRSATYLAAGRPVITQDTGFGSTLPTGEGLFAFTSQEDVLAAVEEIDADYARHSSAALAIAREHFDATRVLGRLVEEAGAGRATRGTPAGLELVPVSKRPTTLSPRTVEVALSRPLPPPGPPVTEPDLSVIVVTVDGLPFTRLCVESVLTGSEAGLELIVVDNASTDGTREYLDALASHDPRVRVVENEHNRGFAPATNQGLELARGNALVCLNNDTLLPPRALDRLVAQLADGSVGLVGPVSNNAATAAEIDVAYTTARGLWREAERRHRLHATDVRDLSVVTLYCAALRREVVERVGPLDERFEVGFFEDDDYSLRVREAGFRVVCAEGVLVHHFGEASFGRLAATGERSRLFAENRRRFEDKWGRTWEEHRRRPNAEYERVKSRIREIVSVAIPEGSSVLVVSKGDDELLALNGHRASHFPQLDDGTYAGHHPADGDEAIAQLAALQARGAEFLLFPKTSLWWLEHYPALTDYLTTRSDRAPVADESCVIYDLGVR